MINKFNLINKRIIITGASSGIGRECSILLSELGADLIICGRNEQRLIETKNALQNPEKHQLFVGDLSNEAIINKLLNCVDKFDGLLLVAGIVKTVPIKFLNIEEINNIISTNFISPVLIVQKAIKLKKINKNGSIVFMSSIAGNFLADKGNGAYAASKAAINGICKVMAIEFASQKIRVNAICPGMVKTPMTNNELAAVTKEQLELNESMYPLGSGDPIDIAWSTAYFLSDVSKWVTGTSFVIDGGFTII
jgi:NAD(P)-dependent dehydrogenase (short-subunit alcohol dehydrogenase family)